MLPYGVNTYHLGKKHSAEPLGLPGSATCPYPAGDPIRPRSSLAHGKSKRPTRLLNPRPGARGLGGKAYLALQKEAAKYLPNAFCGIALPHEISSSTSESLSSICRLSAKLRHSVTASSSHSQPRGSNRRAPSSSACSSSAG